MRTKGLSFSIHADEGLDFFQEEPVLHLPSSRQSITLQDHVPLPLRLLHRFHALSDRVSEYAHNTYPQEILPHAHVGIRLYNSYFNQQIPPRNVSPFPFLHSPHHTPGINLFVRAPYSTYDSPNCFTIISSSRRRRKMNISVKTTKPEGPAIQFERRSAWLSMPK